MPHTWRVAVWPAFIAGVVAFNAGVIIGGCQARRQAADPPATYHVRRIIDGDTLEVVDRGGIRTRVRLQDVDAPELDEPGGQEASDALRAEFLHRQVHVTPHARDTYGRLVADIALADPAPSPEIRR